MSDFWKVRGDVNDTATVALSGVQDLTTVASVRGLVRLGRTRASLSAVVLSPVTRQVKHQLGSAVGWLKTAENGDWRLETEVTFLDGTILTWPEQGTDWIHVRDQLDV